MTSLLTRARNGLSAWREDIDEAAAGIPVAGRVFARRWRILHVESGGMRYEDSTGQTVSLPEGLSAEDAREQIAGLSNSGPLVLRFAEALGFRRTTQFPAAASAHLRDAAQLALPRLSPLPADNTAFAIESRTASGTESRIEVTLAIIRRSALEAALDRATLIGLQPNAVDLAGTDPAAPPTYDLRPGHRAPGTGRSAFRLGTILVLVCLIAAAALAADTRLRLQPRLASLETPAALEASLQAAVVQARAKSTAGSVTIALADLSRRLPDGAYVTSFSYEAGSVRVTGLAWDAAAALRALDAAPEFAGATFSDATVRDEDTGRERFQIVARHRIVEGGAP
ncbi:PilN domain-containing protein [Hyphobacterium marinum]|uniref:PilN domain-containing protein n=1 Tax=Hyphobacterium marinum TaxID=3116574 RepID=A0ABU7LVY9_9PROT|nr:PilN domain-containing protein [Hyphobacterium sp. Y6023]MEE2565721.1 PilN domain-containing protein [Hyphobacterium sp. Y6023]